MVWRIFTGELPPSPDPAQAIYLLINFALIYLLLLYALLALHRKDEPSRLVQVGLFGILLTFEMWKWSSDSFEITFYGHYRPFSPTTHVGFVQLVLLLLAIWASFVWILTNESLDAEVSAETLRLGHHPSDGQEPEIIEAEIITNEDSARPHQEPKVNVLEGEVSPKRNMEGERSDQRRRLKDRN